MLHMKKFTMIDYFVKCSYCGEKLRVDAKEWPGKYWAIVHKDCLIPMLKTITNAKRFSLVDYKHSYTIN